MLSDIEGAEEKLRELHELYSELTKKIQVSAPVNQQTGVINPEWLMNKFVSMQSKFVSLQYRILLMEIEMKVLSNPTKESDVDVFERAISKVMSDLQEQKKQINLEKFKVNRNGSLN